MSAGEDARGGASILFRPRCNEAGNNGGDEKDCAMCKELKDAIAADARRSDMEGMVRIDCGACGAISIASGGDVHKPGFRKQEQERQLTNKLRWREGEARPKK